MSTPPEVVAARMHTAFNWVTVRDLDECAELLSRIELAARDVSAIYVGNLLADAREIVESLIDVYREPPPGPGPGDGDAPIG